jgi:hypothetical protein
VAHWGVPPALEKGQAASSQSLPALLRSPPALGHTSEAIPQLVAAPARVRLRLTQLGHSAVAIGDRDCTGGLSRGGGRGARQPSMEGGRAKKARAAAALLNDAPGEALRASFGRACPVARRRERVDDEQCDSRSNASVPGRICHLQEALDEHEAGPQVADDPPEHVAL